jgi:hypothetical protein
LNWNAAVDPQSGVSLYHIYRDGVDIGTAATTNFTDGSVNFTAPHTYEVSAENGDGLEGPLSAPLTTQVTGFQDGMLPNGAYMGTADTELREANPTSNQGDDTNLEIDGEDGGVDLWVLLKWQLTSVPVNATILGASLTLNVTNPSSGPYSVYEMKQDWVESEATWQQYRNGQSWQTSGGQGSSDRGTTPVGTMNFSSTGQQTINLNAAGLALLQDWLTGAKANYGFILGDTSNTNGLDFNSHEVAIAGDRPKLSIAYVTGTPADFNRNGQLDCPDADALVVEIVSGNNSTEFDLTDDGIVNRDDLASWLDLAGAANLASGNAYLPGDANLDGVVDGVDFGSWRENRFASVAAWCAGDFNADSAVDAADFNIWNEHRFMASLGAAAAAVNEPQTDARRVPRAPLAGQNLANHDLELPIASTQWHARSTSTTNTNIVTIDGWRQVSHDGNSDATSDLSERQLSFVRTAQPRSPTIGNHSASGQLCSK